jgi:hypothetical protein
LLRSVAVTPFRLVADPALKPTREDDVRQALEPAMELTTPIDITDGIVRGAQSNKITRNAHWKKRVTTFKTFARENA